MGSGRSCNAGISEAGSDGPHLKFAMPKGFTEVLNKTDSVKMIALDSFSGFLD